MLSESEIERYSRQLILSNWSEEKQLALKALSISLPANLEATARYLAAMGVGQIHFIDASQQQLDQLQALNPDILITNIRPENVDFKLFYAGKILTFQDANREILWQDHHRENISDISFASHIVSAVLKVILEQY